MPGTGVLFGSHNWRSMDLILEVAYLGLGNATAEGAVPRKSRSAWRLDSCMRVAIRFEGCALWNLTEVMPYLSRRAIENKSVLGDGGAADERKRAGAEIWARLFG
ncbi:hypothetical protein WOLCODRAFT_159813 [Wolfiporia cocos MD-104 SS10]|uniref:Uncharacterized protein n=1 Tax=Wolfiporia cocos (strain MD-104) TaxID=742152 RepID=A0A2H3J8R4_WOLCO|nr:hypothetical protein WOLCODRAFT_159813 [Wolfiporia cocos MD-104 SS10]